MLAKQVTRLTLGLTLIIIVLYVGALIFHKKFIFQAKELDESYEFQFEEPFLEFFLDTPGGEKLNALLFKTANNPKGLILYFHGNADNLQRWGTYAIDFTALGYDVLMVDYQGYGKSTGTPSEQALYSDADFIWDWSQKNFNYDKYVLYGRSLGSAVASYLAKGKDPSLLILETPFNIITQDIPKVLLPFSLENMFSNETHLSSVTSDIVIIHGDKDRLTKLSSAKKLEPLLKPSDEFVVIRGGRHKNLRKFSEFHETLARIL